MSGDARQNEPVCPSREALEVLTHALEAEMERSAYWRSRAKHAAKKRRGPNYNAYLARERRKARRRRERP